MGTLILVFCTAFFVVLYATPPLIKVAILKRLFDEPGERKIHTRVVPTIGGVISFAATLFSFSLWFEIQDLTNPFNVRQYVTEFKLLVATSLVLFFVGIKDDIIGTAPVKKLVAHVIVGLILVLIGNVRITGLHGIFEVQELPYWGSVFLSLFTYIVVVNALNLIDGVDGLAGGVGFIASSAFATWFFFANDYVYASLALALAGALLGFLVFNFSPAKIFMGDSGSLTIGLIISILAIKLISYDVSSIHNEFILNVSKPIFAMAVLVYPLIDTLRIFIYRAVQGVSPFSADRNHLHHRLLDIGLTHKKAVLIIYFVNILIISLTLVLSSIYMNANYSLIIVAATSLFIAQIPFFVKKKKNRVEKEEKE